MSSRLEDIWRFACGLTRDIFSRALPRTDMALSGSAELGIMLARNSDLCGSRLELQALSAIS